MVKFYIKNIFRFAAFVFLPGLIRLKERVYNGETFIHVDFKEKGLPLIISFAGLGDQFNFGNTLIAFHANVIYLRDLNHNWYLNGLPAVGSSVDEMLALFKQKINEYEPSRVITMGASAGGFGAILFGCLLKADSVIAFSPQTFMNKLNCIVHLDYRWLDRVIQIYNGDKRNRPFLDIKQLVSHSTVPITVIFDVTHRLDNLHAMRIKGAHVVQEGVQGGGHALVKELRHNDMLTATIQNAITPGKRS